ncbi:MAG TPA: hypothetical protein VMJ13_03080 [Candidatus Acidoferrum sp.]|nr:hypothetical protein [Candidatus Acidoferrum sp.]
MRSHKILSAMVLSALIAGFAGTSPAHPSPAPQKTVTVPAGTSILVRMLDTVDSSKNPPGSRFSAVLETNLVVNGKVVVPKGNTVYGRLAEAKQAGRATGSSELQLELTDIVVGGTAYPILTSDYQVKGSSSTKRSAKRLLGGAGLGAVIGGIAGNAGMGAAIGATAGAVGSVAQKGKSVNVPSETLLEFRLQQPASLPAR